MNKKKSVIWNIGLIISLVCWLAIDLTGFFLTHHILRLIIEGILVMSIFFLLKGAWEKKNYFQRLQQQQLGSLFANMNEAVWTLDSEGRITQCNKKAEEYSGYSSDQLVGIRYDEYSGWTQSELDKHRVHVESALQGIPQNYEISIYNKKGHKLDLAINLIPIVVDGSVVELLCIGENITERKEKLRQLKENEKRYRELVELSPEPIVVHGSGKVIYVNHAALKLFKAKSAQEVLGKSTLDLVVPEYREQLIKRSKAVVEKGVNHLLEYRLQCLDGTSVDVEAISVVTEYDHNSAIHTIVRDITERKKNQERIIESKRRYRNLVENLPIMIAVYHIDTLLYMNQAGVELLGFTSKEELIGKKIVDIVHPSMKDRIMQGLENIDPLDERREGIELQVRRLDGTWLDLEVTSMSIGFEGKDARQLFIRDVTERKKAEETIYQLAYHDPLTNLANRRMFLKRLSEEIQMTKQTSNKFALLYIDMDRFKNINDSLGHHVGDQILMEVSRRFTRWGHQQGLIARMGGDEFTVLLPFSDQEQVYTFAETIINEFKVPIQIRQEELYITPSIGIALYPLHATDSSLLLSYADTAMYQAKRTGKNTYFMYNEELEKEIREKSMLENDLRKSIENRQFEVHYQPKFNLKTKKITGAECLVRWVHPKLGMIPPNKFIPLAEETGLIVPLGQLVLEIACRDYKEWVRAGLSEFRIAVNVAVQQFMQPNFVALVKEILDSTGLHPKFLELEITESALMENTEGSVDTINALNDMGIIVSIDDFGTGYSSLSYLSHLPIQTLKIDRSFIDNISPESSTHSLITSILALARNLNLNVVAEGIEKDYQLRLLVDQGCQEGQGYIFSKPLPSKEFFTFLKENQESIVTQ